MFKVYHSIVQYLVYEKSKMVFLLFLLLLEETMALEARGMIKSPGYPGQYPNNNNSTWIINTPDDASDVLIEIHDQDIEFTPGFECTDYLKIEEVSDNGNYLLYRQCGKGSISQIRAKGNKIKVSFISDDSKTGKGFNLTWSVFNYKREPSTLTSTTVTSTKILKLSSKDQDDSSTHENIRHSSSSTRSSPTLTDGTWTTFPNSHMTNQSQQFPIWSTQSRGILTNIQHTTPWEQSSKRTGNSTILSMLLRTSSSKSKDETTSVQNFYLLTTEIAKNKISEKQNGSNTRTPFIKYTTFSSVHQTVTPLSVHSSEVLHVPTTKSLSVNSDHFTTRSGSTLDTNEQASTVKNSHGEDFLNLSSTKPVDVDDSNSLLITIENNTDKFPSTETIRLKSTLQILIQDPKSIDLNGLSLTFLCIIGVLILLAGSLILFIAVQQHKIKRLEKLPGATFLGIRDRYSTISEMVDRNIERQPYSNLKQSHITGSKTNKLPNDYVYSFLEECKRDVKPLNVMHLQDKATRRSFVPEDLTELQEKAEYIEILPDRVSYCQDTTTFGGKCSDHVYTQISKKRDDTIVDEETKFDETSLQQGSSDVHDRTAPVFANIFLENDDDFSGLAMASKSGNVSDDERENSMAEEYTNNVYEDLPI